MVVRRKAAASAAVLMPVNQPSPALCALADDLFSRLAAGVDRKRAMKAADEVRYRATLLAFTAAVARIALAQVPPFNGVSVSFDERRYANSLISPTHSRTIRDGLSSLGFIVVGRGFYNKAAPKKSFATRIRHTSEFADLAREHGLRLNDLFRPPAEVIALKGAEGGAVPDDVRASEGVLHRYNDFIRRFDLTLPPEAWQELTALIIKGRGTNGKGWKLHKGYDDSRIYLVRRFSESYERGGRLYDGFWQNMPKAIRQRLLIDGEPTVELDFSRIHPTIIFADKGQTLDIDPYDVPGFPDMEAAGKETFNRLLNSRRKIAFRNRKDRKWFADKEEFNRYRDAMIAHLSPIKDTFQRDYGARLQKRDGELALKILRRCMDEGFPVYPVHDSFIVRASDRDRLHRIMDEDFAGMFKVHCTIK